MGWRNPFQFKVFGETDRRVLASGVAVVDELAGCGGMTFVTALPHGHPQRDHHQIGGLGGGRVPGHDPLSEHVDDEGHVDKTRPGPHVSEVGDPYPVRGRVTDFT